MRIAFFTGTFPVASETFIVRQILGLLRQGHEVDIFADLRPEPGSPIHPEVERNGLLSRTIYMDLPAETVPWEMPVWPLTARTWPPGASESVLNMVRAGRAIPALLRSLTRAPRLCFQALSCSHYGYQAASLSALHRLGKLARIRKRYDVLHAHFGPVGNSFRFARALWRAPLVVSFHGFDFSTLPRREGPRLYEKLFATADCVTVNSSFTQGRLEGLGCPADKLRLLPVGLDLAEFPLRERTLKPGESVRLLSVARLVEIKGHEFAIRAVAKLRETHSALRYDIVGDGPLRAPLTALIQELGLQEIVHLHGTLRSDQIQRLMSDAHIGILASVSVDGDQEGQGLALQEAQACGLPVVATRHGALPEGLIEGETGFLVPERDAEQLAERLRYLIEHAEHWPAWGCAGRAFVERRYDIVKLTRQLLDIYSEASERLKRS